MPPLRRKPWTPRDDERRARDAARRKARRDEQKAAGTYQRPKSDYRLAPYARQFSAIIGYPVNPDDFSSPRAECREAA